MGFVRFTLLPTLTSNADRSQRHARSVDTREHQCTEQLGRFLGRFGLLVLGSFIEDWGSQALRVPTQCSVTVSR